MQQKREQPLRLRELIKEVRACKTAAEERAVVSQEASEIRDSFRDENYKFRHRSVAKLLFIQMMGYPTNFGQMECLKLIASTNFTEKRVGYLGLTQLLNEKDDVLVMVTNSMQIDMNNSNTRISGIALTALANIATGEMCRDLSKDVCRLMSHSNSYIRKKAAMAGCRVVRKCPDMIEEIAEEVPKLLQDRSHVVVMNGVNLLLEILKIESSAKQGFEQYLELLVRALKNLLHTVHSPEHSIGGVIDPFLQVSLLKLLGQLGVGKNNEELADCLAQVATNTESTKNPGNSVLYECVRTILDIEGTSGLKVLATNIMGRFLMNRDNNLRYVALNSLLKFVKFDQIAVQRHKQTILECLKDIDITIRKKALELTYSIINESNVTQIVQEMINFLIESEAEFKEALVTKICLAVEMHSPSRVWQIDTIIRVLTLAGVYVPEEVVASTAHIISDSSELHSYSVHKLFRALRDNKDQQGLVLLSIWAIGEFGNFLLTSSQDGDLEYEAVSGDQILSSLSEVMKNGDQTLKEYTLTALVKLSVRLPETSEAIKKLLEKEKASINVELQQRSCEYLQLLESNWSQVRKPLLENIPPYKKAVEKPQLTEVKSQPALKKEHNLLDLDLIFDSDTQENPSQPAPPTESLIDIFESNTDRFSEFEEAKPSETFDLVAFEDEEIKVSFSCSKPSEPKTTFIQAVSTNKTSAAISNFKLSVAVQKHLTLSLSNATSNYINPGESTRQDMNITNTQQGQKPIVVRLKIDYTLGSNKSKMTTVDSFPKDF